jgi:hypothetical protein
MSDMRLRYSIYAMMSLMCACIYFVDYCGLLRWLATPLKGGHIYIVAVCNVI